MTAGGMMRVFVPTTPSQLAQWAESGLITEVVSAHALTPALASWFDGADTEELEYAALHEASEASLKMLVAEQKKASRRLVLSIDVEVLLSPSNPEPRSLVTVPDTLKLSDVVSLHVDDEDAEAVIMAAVAGLRRQAPEDELGVLLDDAAEYELMWFDKSELSVVLGLVTS